MLLVSLAASLVENMLTGKGVIQEETAISQGHEANIFEQGTIRADKEAISASQECRTIRAGRSGVSVLPHPLTNFEIQQSYQNESRFDGVYSINNLANIKDVVYVIIG